jgi:hypothetical protein
MMTKMDDGAQIEQSVINVNSISIANDLWTHKAERDAMVSAAQGYLQSHATN